ncbi:MAG: MBL fold metallo-hydrolase [Myxococcales bacterium]
MPADIEWLGGGIHLAGSSLWFDAPRRQALSFVSHAHGDHIARHEQVIATDATARLMAQRLGRLPGALTVPYRQPFDMGPLRLELFPAGHILGSAQILVERGGRRIVYTGDLCLSPSSTAEAAAFVPCDTLVVEATFGHPRYRLPSRPEALARVEEMVQRAHANGEIPVLLAYALGKSQEVIRHLGDRGHRLRADDTICALSQVYRESGCALPPVARYRGSVEPGEVLIIPPHRVRAPSIRRLPRRRTAVLTGWALDAEGARRYRADEAIPLSDHADFAQLVEYVERSGAKQVYTVHGFCQPLADELRARGFRASPLDRGLQLELFE